MGDTAEVTSHARTTLNDRVTTTFFQRLETTDAGPLCRLAGEGSASLVDTAGLSGLLVVSLLPRIVFYCMRTFACRCLQRCATPVYGVHLSSSAMVLVW
ncbi:hypothetical protein HPB47_004813 [Ixodes persulcatus]|uniref:Uncharacterized protein n=1 Tax=Ixodes persulcatus TaxID=34615 RepID=A0AC60PEN0_IXOPE|nr:hypothetical protein HPB47_004813 [Ixodes persulcatus]